MAARPTAPTLISRTDLRNCTGPGEVFALLRRLGYSTELEPVSVPLEAGDLPESLRAGVVARYLVARLGGARPGEPSLDVTLFVVDGGEHKSALVRGIAANWTRRYPGDHLLIFAVRGGDGEYSQLTFVNTERLGEGAQVRVKLRKLIVERGYPTRHDVDTLARIALSPGADDARAAFRAQIEAFNVERMTDTFYKEYANLYARAVARIRDDNKGIADFYDPAKLHAFAQRLFGRVMFLYFLQKKRALDDNLNFIGQQYDDTVRRDENFYWAVLEPLFFETLNKPRPDQRSPQFGHVPYLNGGLFAEDSLDHRGAVVLDNEIFDARGEGGILYFLSNHNFTIEEDTPLEVEVALDPEMLGKVFENLLEAEERGKSGTFYTPRPVVAFMCREALAAYLEREAAVDAATLGWLLDEAEMGDPARDERGEPRLTHRNLPRQTREQIERALEAVRVLDPAVGSGAFPLGMLALLVGVRRALYRIAQVEIAPSSRLVEGWKRNFIRDCLYGVDIKPEAIEIARLRLWLSLVVDADPYDMEPLPNLDYKLMTGDSLVETFEGVAIYPTRPKAAQPALLGDDSTRTLIENLHTLQNQYFQPDDAVNRGDLRNQIRETEVQIVRATLDQRVADETTRLKRLNAQLANLHGKPAPRDLAAEQQTLTHSIEMTEAALRDLRADKLPFFLYRLHFAPVFEQKDGFDIVIANPPYVSIEHMSADYKETLKGIYPAVAAGRADLYVYFYARALELLRDGGTLCFISSNKFFRAGYGKGLRETLKDTAAVRLVIDFGDFPVFDASAYPCILIAGKGSPAEGHTYRGLTAGNDIALDKIGETLALAGQTRAQAEGVQPPTGDAATGALVRKLMGMGAPLGKYVSGKIYYGIKTGLNEAFVVDQATRDRLIAEDARSAEVLKPFLRGRDVNRYEYPEPKVWILAAYHGIDISAYPAVEAYLEAFETRLENRATTQAWYELQQPQSAYWLGFQGPKIVYPDIASQAEFCFDTSGSYLDMTLFCLPVDTIYLIGILNSQLSDFMLKQISPSIRGGFHRYKREYVALLPIVEPTAGEKRRLEEIVGRLGDLTPQPPLPRGEGEPEPGGEGEREALEREVDEIVYRVYGLSAEEIALIEAWHAQRRALLGKG